MDEWIRWCVQKDTPAMDWRRMATYISATENIKLLLVMLEMYN